MSWSHKIGSLRWSKRANRLDEATEPRSYDRRFYSGTLLAATVLIAAVIGFAVYHTAFIKVDTQPDPAFDLSSLVAGSGGLPDTRNPCIVLQEYLEANRRKSYNVAYSYLCKGLKKEVSLQDFVSNAKANTLLFNDISSYRASSYRKNSSAASASGYVVYKSGDRSRVEATFAREGSSWKIALITVIYQ